MRVGRWTSEPKMAWLQFTPLLRWAASPASSGWFVHTIFVLSVSYYWLPVYTDVKRQVLVKVMAVAFGRVPIRPFKSSLYKRDDVGKLVVSLPAKPKRAGPVLTVCTNGPSNPRRCNSLVLGRRKCAWKERRTGDDVMREQVFCFPCPIHIFQPRLDVLLWL